jgi:hypothetical protein
LALGKAMDWPHFYVAEGSPEDDPLALALSWCVSVRDGFLSFPYF